MNFRQKNNFGSSRNGRKSPLILVCVVIFLILIFTFSASRNFLLTLFSPLWNVENSFITFFKSNTILLESKESLIAQNNMLQQEVTQNQENTLFDTLLKSENDDLKNILNRKPQNQKQILAAVLEKPFLSPYDTLIVDAGSADGVSVNDKVLADGNDFIGYVSSVSAHSAKIVLYSSPGQQTQVLIGSSATEQTALGLGGGNFSVQLPKGANVAIGDPITLPSISANIFATVENIDTTQTDSFETVEFRSPVNIDELVWVEILPTS
jgi:rod shape-determining protein MreC